MKMSAPGVEPSRVVAAVTAFGIVGTIVLLYIACSVEIVEMTMGGVVGVFNDVIHQPRSNRFTIFGIVAGLPELYLQIVMAVFVFIIPTLYLLLLLLLWITPLKPQTQLRIFALCQTLFAWSSFDCFLVAFVGAAVGGERYGIGQFLQEIVYNQNVGPLCRGLQKVDIECLTVKMVVLPGTAWLVSTELAFILVSSFVYRWVYRRLHVGVK